MHRAYAFVIDSMSAGLSSGPWPLMISDVARTAMAWRCKQQAWIETLIEKILLVNEETCPNLFETLLEVDHMIKSNKTLVKFK